MSYKVVLLWQTGTVTCEPKIYEKPTPDVGQIIKIETATGDVVTGRTVKIGGGPAMKAPVEIGIVQAVEITP